MEYFNALESKSAEVDKLTKRVQELTKSNTALNTQVQEITEQVNTLTRDKETLSTSNTTLKTQIEGLNKQVETLKQEKEVLRSIDIVRDKMPYVLNQVLNDPTLLKAMSNDDLLNILMTISACTYQPEKVKKLVSEIAKEIETRGLDKPDGYHK
ncbi:hypothetical protein [Helicobacter suis]|uniref:hypothetical protein n=1 Tax=Helicobacter suis TaxID=104628 RepID=UPI0013D12AC6|nr:hypothetical protein [Helicobacter suis]